jgi:hypothetical protein
MQKITRGKVVTGPKTGMEARESPVFLLAQRHEHDCWNVLTLHTAGCPVCLAARRVHGLNGCGCDLGLDCRAAWLIAAKRRWELSPQYVATQSMTRVSKRKEA